MDMETLRTAKKLEHEIEYLTDVINSIAKDGLKLEYAKRSDNGLIPDRILVDNTVKDIVVTHLSGRLTNAKKLLEEL